MREGTGGDGRGQSTEGANDRGGGGEREREKGGARWRVHSVTDLVNRPAERPDGLGLVTDRGAEPLALLQPLERLGRSQQPWGVD